MTDLTLEEYRRYHPNEIIRKIREDAEKAFGLRGISLKTKRITASPKITTALKTKFPFIHLKKSR